MGNKSSRVYFTRLRRRVCGAADSRLHNDTRPPLRSPRESGLNATRQKCGTCSKSARGSRFKRQSDQTVAFLIYSKAINLTHCSIEGQTKRLISFEVFAHLLSSPCCFGKVILKGKASPFEAIALRKQPNRDRTPGAFVKRFSCR